MSRATTRQSIADALVRAEELDRADGAEWVWTTDWAVFDELDAAVRHARAPLRRNVVVWRVCSVVALAALFVGVLIVESSALPGLARLVISIVMILVVSCAAKILLEYPGYSSTRAWMHGAAIAHPVYFEGGTPYSRSRMVFGRQCLYLIAEGGTIAQLPWSSASVIGVDIRLSGAAIVISIDGRFVALSTAGRVNGPLSLAWTVGWFGQPTTFKRALLADLERTGVPVAAVDWSALAA